MITNSDPTLSCPWVLNFTSTHPKMKYEICILDATYGFQRAGLKASIFQLWRRWLVEHLLFYPDRMARRSD